MALKRLSKLSYGTLSSLSPALAALAGWLLLKEQISMWQTLALVCIMIASVGVTFRAKPATVMKRFKSQKMALAIFCLKWT